MELLEWKFWLGLMRSPKASMEKAKAEGSVKKAFGIVFFGYILISIVSFLFFSALSLVIQLPWPMLVNPLVMLFSVFFGTLFYLVISGIVHLVAKVLGGKGTFGGQAYLFALVWVLSMPIVTLGAVLYFVPCLGFIVMFCMLAYLAYMYVVAIQAAQGFEIWKAVLVVVVLILAYFIIGFIVMLAAVASLGPQGMMTAMSGIGKTFISAYGMDESYCMKVTDSKARDSCYMSVGAYGNASACEKILETKTRDLCFSSHAMFNKDSSVCERIADNEQRDSCLKTAETLGKD